jgi:glutathione-regulated potassium-efflux system protein KefB
VIAICIDQRESIDKIVASIKEEFPLARVMARSYDRGHTLDLIAAGVDYQMRETFESAVAFGRQALRELDIPDEEAEEIVEDVRRRDAERLQVQATGGLMAGRDLMRGNEPTPGPLVKPKRAAQALSEETAVVAVEDGDEQPPR